MRIDAILRFLQSKGRGRIFSRPLVVTANNIEAEMNSGSVINVRLSGEKTASLQEIKTGVTLRVTPRLIPNPGDNRSQDQILLKVYAETSSPMAGINVDGIPQINSQHASTEVTVLQGEPYLVSGLIKDRESMNQSGFRCCRIFLLLVGFFVPKDLHLLWIMSWYLSLRPDWNLFLSKDCLT